MILALSFYPLGFTLLSLVLNCVELLVSLSRV